MNDSSKITKSRRKPLLSRIPTSFVQAVLKGHSGLGIAFAAAIYIVCFSGTLVVFYNEFLRWENPAAPQIDEVSPELVQTVIGNIPSAGGEGIEHVYLTMPDYDRPFMRVDIDAEKDSDWIAGEDGDLAVPLRSAWSNFLLRLHIYLHLPTSWGMFIVGLTGVALLSSLFSGILAHPRIFRDAFHLRVGGSARLQEADLHNRIGVWGLPFHIVVSLTGAFLGIVTITVGVLGMAMFDGDTNRIYELFQPQQPADNSAPTELIDVRPFFEQVPDDARLRRIVLEHPAEMGAAALLETEDDNVLAGESQYAFDRAGELYFSREKEELTLGERVLGSLGPLHFGWFAGGIVKIAYGLLGLGLTYLAVGGVKIWLARRRDKGRPAPGWERVWAAVVWGQPVAMAIAAFAAILFPGADYSALIPVWGGVTLFTLATAALLPSMLIARGGKALTGLTLIALGLYHGAFHAIYATGSADIIWAIDAILIAGGALLVAMAMILADRGTAHTA